MTGTETERVTLCRVRRPLDDQVQLGGSTISHRNTGAVEVDCWASPHVQDLLARHRLLDSWDIVRRLTFSRDFQPGRIDRHAHHRARRVCGIDRHVSGDRWRDDFVRVACGKTEDARLADGNRRAASSRIDCIRLGSRVERDRRYRDSTDEKERSIVRNSNLPSQSECRLSSMRSLRECARLSPLEFRNAKASFTVSFLLLAGSRSRGLPTDSWAAPSLIPCEATPMRRRFVPW